METKQLKPLPVGIQTFDKLIEGGYLYVDKTAYLYSRCRGPYTYWSCGYGDAHGQDIIPLRVEIESKCGDCHEPDRFEGLSQSVRYVWTSHYLRWVSTSIRKCVR